MQFKNTLATLIVAAALPLAAGAHFAKNGIYVHGFGGVALPQNPGSGLRADTGYNLGAALGVKKGNFRYELEVNHQSALVRDTAFALVRRGNATIFAPMVNVHYDFDHLMHISPRLVPSVGIGVGYATLNMRDSVGFLANNNAFAYQAMANLQYHIDHNWSMNVGYKYFGTTDFSWRPSVASALAGGVQIDKSWQNHMINLGVTYRL